MAAATDYEAAVVGAVGVEIDESLETWEEEGRVSLVVLVGGMGSAWLNLQRKPGLAGSWSWCGHGLLQLCQSGVGRFESKYTYFAGRSSRLSSCQSYYLWRVPEGKLT